jgi:lanosterol synthase
LERTDPVFVRAADWLISKQQADGGWGESYMSCLEHRYIGRESQVTMTSWALLALMDILGPGAPSVLRGIEWLRTRVRGDGTVPPEGLNGIYFTTCGLDYHLYRVYFPAMALARYESKVAYGN